MVFDESGLSNPRRVCNEITHTQKKNVLFFKSININNTFLYRRKPGYCMLKRRSNRDEEKVLCHGDGV